MSYFTKDFISFFEELEMNNNREWFLENKKRYELSVKLPFENFIQDMIYKIHEDDEKLMITAKEAIFRIYRDIRFSKDKTPYKNHASAIISRGGRKNLSDPGIYIEINAKYIRLYSGIYQPSSEQLSMIRNYIANNSEEFNTILKDKLFKRFFGTIRGEQNKRIPKEYNEIVKIQPLISNKQFYYFTELDSKKILSNTLPNTLMKYYFAAKPMGEYFKRALTT